MRVLIVILFFLSPLALQSQSRYELYCHKCITCISLNVLTAQVGIKEETGRNDGKRVEEYLSSCGLKRGNAYCAAGQFYCFSEAVKILDYPLDSIPIPQTGVASRHFAFARKYGQQTTYKPKVGDLIIWKKINSWQGHIERIVKVGKGGWVRTVGFNTSNGETGSQREGNGVFYRKRNVYHLLGRMKVYGIVGFYA